MPDDNTQIIPPPRMARRPVSIKGLLPSLPERGKIKIGIRGKMINSRQGKEFQPPQKLDHFRVTTLERGQDGNFIIDHAFHERYGDRPTEIPVRLLYDDISVNFPTRYACFIGRTLWCSGDGETAIRLSDSPPRNRAELEQMRPEPRQVPCPCHRQDPSYDGRDRCKMNGSLAVIIDGAGGLGGVWKFRTTSYNSIVGIMSSMAFIRSITGGPLANIPLKLRITPKQATAPTDGSQVLIYVVGLEFDGDVPRLQEIGHQIALDRARTHVSIQHIEDEARRLLAAPQNAPLPGDDPDDVIDEFYPEQAAPPQRPKPQDFQQEHFDEGLGFMLSLADGTERQFADPEEAAQGFDAELRTRAKDRGYDGSESAWEDNARLIHDLREAGRDDLAERLHKTRAELAAAHNSYPGDSQDRPAAGAPPPDPARGATASAEAGHTEHPGGESQSTPEERRTGAGSEDDRPRDADSLVVNLVKPLGKPIDYVATKDKMLTVIATKIKTVADVERFSIENRATINNWIQVGKNNQQIGDLWRDVKYYLVQRENQLRSGEA